MCESPDRNAKCSCKSKISKLQSIGASVNQKILWLQVTMEHPVRVAISNSLQNLVKKHLQGTNVAKLGIRLQQKRSVLSRLLCP